MLTISACRAATDSTRRPPPPMMIGAARALDRSRRERVLGDRVVVAGEVEGPVGLEQAGDHRQTPPRSGRPARPGGRRRCPTGRSRCASIRRPGRARAGRRRAGRWWPPPWPGPGGGGSRCRRPARRCAGWWWPRRRPSWPAPAPAGRRSGRASARSSSRGPRPCAPARPTTAPCRRAPAQLRGETELAIVCHGDIVPHIARCAPAGAIEPARGGPT